tara:strand:+ start:2320 stop:2445 length:126 start_codon:yes stop_codon:yes gene_type:complete
MDNHIVRGLKTQSNLVVLNSYDDDIDLDFSVGDLHPLTLLP